MSCLTLLISCRRYALAYFTLHAAQQLVAVAYVVKSAEFFVKVRSRQMLFLPEILSRIS